VGRGPSLLPDGDADGGPVTGEGTAPAVPPTGPPPARGRSADAGADSAEGYGTRKAMRVLPLGAGMALLGLGLGFLAIRMRRL
jgi:hypothetical protein